MTSSRFLPIALLLPLLGACRSEQASAPPAPPPPEVSVVTLTTGPVVLTRELPGRTESFLVADVRPQATGIVRERLFTEGSLVEAGQPLYQLDDAAYLANYNSAEAAVARAEASLELARQNANRTRELLEANAVSRQERDNAVAALRQAEADLAVAQAALASAEVPLGYSRIVSPISGRIGRSSVTMGALVTANQPEPLATVQQLDPIYVNLARSSREVLELRQAIEAGSLDRQEDPPVTLLLEDGSTHAHTGTVAFSEVSVDPTTGSLTLRAVVPNPEQVLLPGMYVRAIVREGVRENGILVPQRGIARSPNGETIAMVVEPDGTVAQRNVVVSRTVGDQWLVEEGLAAGDRVIIAGLQKIRPGMPVTIEVPASEAPVNAATE